MPRPFQDVHPALSYPLNVTANASRRVGDSGMKILCRDNKWHGEVDQRGHEQAAPSDAVVRLRLPPSAVELWVMIETVSLK